MKVIDPRTYDVNSLNESKIENTIESYYQGDKSLFLQRYSELSDGEKFYTLSATVLTLTNYTDAKRMYLEELRNDLMILKVLNKGDIKWSINDNSYKKIIKKLPKGYQTYWKSEIVSDTIAKFEDIANQIKNNLKIILES
jgi:hypothetical protein